MILNHKSGIQTTESWCLGMQSLFQRQAPVSSNEKPKEHTRQTIKLLCRTCATPWERCKGNELHGLVQLYVPSAAYKTMLAASLAASKTKLEDKSQWVNETVPAKEPKSTRVFAPCINCEGVASRDILRHGLVSKSEWNWSFVEL